MKCPFVCLKDIAGRKNEVAADLACRFGIECSKRMLKQIHCRFNMTTDGGNYEEFAAFCFKFHAKHYDHQCSSTEEYPELKTQLLWDNAVAAALANNEGIN